MRGNYTLIFPSLALSPEKHNGPLCVPLGLSAKGRIFTEEWDRGWGVYDAISSPFPPSFVTPRLLPRSHFPQLSLCLQTSPDGYLPFTPGAFRTLAKCSFIIHL